MTVFSLGKDSHKEKWEGARTSRDDAIQYFKADDVQSITLFPQTFKLLKDDPSYIYIDMPSGMSRRGRPMSHRALLKVRRLLARNTDTDRSHYPSTFRQLQIRLVRSSMLL